MDASSIVSDLLLEPYCFVRPVAPSSARTIKPARGDDFDDILCFTRPQHANAADTPAAPSRRRAAAPRHGLLTPREREVAFRLTAHVSNRELAQSLHISERTAAHHVRSILSNLELRSRFQVTRDLLLAFGYSDQA